MPAVVTEFITAVFNNNMAKTIVSVVKYTAMRHLCRMFLFGITSEVLKLSFTSVYQVCNVKQNY
jgi:hypothetical protein